MCNPLKFSEFQRRQTGKYGIGVFATKDIEVGDLVCDYPGKVVTETEYNQLLTDNPSDEDLIKEYAQDLGGVCFHLFSSFYLSTLALRFL